MFPLYLLLVLAVAILAFIAGRSRGRALGASGVRLHSLPTYHGLFTASAAIIPMLALLVDLGPRRASAHRAFRDRYPSCRPPARRRYGPRRGDPRHPDGRRRPRRAERCPSGGGRHLRRLAVRAERRAYGSRRPPWRPRRMVGVFEPRAALPRPQPVRERRQGRADRLFGGGDPDHRRHRLLGPLRDPPVLCALPGVRFPVRPPVEPADRDPRGPGRQFRRLRRGAALCRHDPDHADRDADRRPDRPVLGDLHGGIRDTARAVAGQAGPRDSRRRADGGVRLLRRADRCPAPPRPRPSRSASMSPPRARSPPAW